VALVVNAWFTRFASADAWVQTVGVLVAWVACNVAGALLYAIVEKRTHRWARSRPSPGAVPADAWAKQTYSPRYNSWLMRRWFIAVFAVHFFLSVGAFAFGHTDIQMSVSEGNNNLVEVLDDAHHPGQDKDLLGEAPDHGLTDSQPDLPDIIKPVAVSLGTAPAQPFPPDLRWVQPVSPTLEGLQRPPRLPATIG